MTVIARDAVASDHLVYAWPFPIGPECEVACADDEQVVMCPAWLVGDRLGPGRHVWRTPDPSRPVAAFFVLTAPVEVSFDLTTMFLIPNTGQPVRVRASGSLQVRCLDPGLLVAQFVGLPFDRVNDGILRSVSRSVERMLARLLTRRVVMTNSPLAVTDPAMLPSIIEEVIAYNPTAGAVFGVELIRMGHLTIVCDDGSTPYIGLPDSARKPPNGESHRTSGIHVAVHVDAAPPTPSEPPRGRSPAEPPPIPRALYQSSPDLTPPPISNSVVSGEIRQRAPSQPDQPPRLPPPPPPPRKPVVEMASVHRSNKEEITQPSAPSPVPGALRIRGESPGEEAHGSIVGIGMAPIGSRVVSGEIAPKVAPGARVLVPGPHGLMQSATVRQLLQGYYELEVGSSGETIWVPVSNVVPES